MEGIKDTLILLNVRYNNILPQNIFKDLDALITNVNTKLSSKYPKYIDYKKGPAYSFIEKLKEAQQKGLSKYKIFKPLLDYSEVDEGQELQSNPTTAIVKSKKKVEIGIQGYF